MASCPGTRNNYRCGGTLFRCKKCGNIGCDQNQPGKCTNQGFRIGKCLKCGANQKELFR